MDVEKQEVQQKIQQEVEQEVDVDRLYQLDKYESDDEIIGGIFFKLFMQNL